jgi:hypothetical protein
LKDASATAIYGSRASNGLAIKKKEKLENWSELQWKSSSFQLLTK